MRKFDLVMMIEGSRINQKRVVDGFFLASFSLFNVEE
jgi:hypothetical protein